MKNEKTSSANVKQAKFYVSMIDTFMSGWGETDGKKNKFIVECETFEQAETVMRNAGKKSNMKYVTMSKSMPKIGSNVVPTYRHFNELGKNWTNNN